MLSLDFALQTFSHLFSRCEYYFHRELLSHHKEFKLKERKLRKKKQGTQPDVFSMALQIARLDLKMTSPSNSRPNSGQSGRRISTQNRPAPDSISGAIKRYAEMSGGEAAASNPVPIVKVETVKDDMT